MFAWARAPVCVDQVPAQQRPPHCPVSAVCRSPWQAAPGDLPCAQQRGVCFAKSTLDVHLLTRKVLMFARSPPVLHRVWRHQFANQPDGVQSVLKMLKQKGNLPPNALRRIRTTVPMHVSCTLMLQQMRSNSGRRACEQAHVEGCTDVH